MQDRILIKHPDSGEYVTLPEIVREYGAVMLVNIPTNNSIQCRDTEGTWIGNLKYDFRDGDTHWHA